MINTHTQRKLQPIQLLKQLNSEHQRTISCSVKFEGIGVHSGQPSSIIIMPASADAGISFINPSYPGDPIHLGYILPEKAPHATVLRSKTWSVSTVEHLLAALSGLGIDNAIIEVYGDEIPILDGSAWPFVVGLQEASFSLIDKPRSYLAVRQPIMLLRDEDRFLELYPPLSHDGVLHVDCSALIAGQISTYSFALDRTASFITDIAPARTFGSLEQLPMLRAHKLAQGSSLGNTVVFENNKPLNALRFPDEPIRHKLLDVIGDSLVLGKQLTGTIKVHNPAHMFNRLIVEHYFNNPPMWEVIT